MTGPEIVKEEAAKVGKTLSDEDINYLLWNETGFPCFYAPKEGETDEDYLRRQVREALTQKVQHGQTRRSGSWLDVWQVVYIGGEYEVSTTCFVSNWLY